MTQRLNKDHWIEAGLLVLARSGIEAVRVERLAEELRVTKGSFYWHFKDRGALLTAMLEAWAAKSTGEIIARADEGGAPAARLKRLFEIVVQGDGRLDRAIRSWAAQNETAAEAARRVDARRFGYLKALFLGLGFAEDVALARARLVYQAYVGQIMAVVPAAAEARRREWVDVLYPMLVAGARQRTT